MSRQDLAASDVAMISETLWRRWWQGNSKALGSSLAVESIPFNVVGVFPDTIRALANVELLLLQRPARSLVDGTMGGGEVQMSSGVIVRLEGAAAAAQLLAALAHRQPRNRDLAVVPLAQSVVSDVERQLLLAAVALGVLLVSGATNVVLLSTSRAQRLRANMAVKWALGAQYRGLVLEHARAAGLITVLGGCIGAWLSVAISKASLTSLPSVAPLVVYGTTLSPTVWFGVTLFLMFYTGMVATAAGVTARSLGGSRGVTILRTGGDRRIVGAVTHAVIGIQFAATILLATAGWHLGLEFRRLAREDRGFVADRMLTFQVPKPGGLRDLAAETGTSVGLDDRVFGALRNLPQVAAAGGMSDLPMSGGLGYGLFAESEGRRTRGLFKVTAVAGDVFGAARIRLLSGAVFGGPGVSAADVILDERAAQALWPSQSAIDRYVRIAGTPARRVAGVVAPVTRLGLAARTAGEIYVHNSHPIQAPFHLTYVVRLANGDGQAAARIREQLLSLGSDIAPLNIRSGSELSSEPFVQYLNGGIALALFAVAIGALAAIGLSGAIWDVVTGREREIAVRLALGGTPGRVQFEVCRRLWATVLVAAGCGGVVTLLTLGWGLALVSPNLTFSWSILATVVGVVVVLAGLLLLLSGWRTVSAVYATRLA